MERWLRTVSSATLLTVSFAAGAATYTVNSTLDLPDADPSDGACATAPPNPVCTLRAAVMQANTTADNDTIVLSATTYVLTRVGYDQNASLGDLDVNGSGGLVIEGNGATIDANGAVTADRAFELVSGGLSLRDLTIRNGATPSYGGAVYAQSLLVLDGVEIVDNTAGLDGGGVYATANLTVSHSLIADNTSQGTLGGGLVASGANAHSVVMDTTEVAGNEVLGSQSGGGGLALKDVGAIVEDIDVHDNFSAGQGGGLYVVNSNSLIFTIASSRFDHNTAATGGGNLSVKGDTKISTTAVSGGSAADGAGILVTAGTLELTDVGVSGNNASAAGGGIEAVNGRLQILRGSVDGNVAATVGGGIDVNGDGNSTLEITDASVHDNRATQDGGGLWSNVLSAIRTSAVYRNRATRGGGIFDKGNMDVDASILDGNVAGTYGGGAYLDNGAIGRFSSATITGNSSRAKYPQAGSGSGLYIDPGALAGARVSVLAYNNNSPQTIAPNDCYGTLSLSGNMFVSTNASCTLPIASGGGNHIGGAYPNTIDPLLTPLQPLYDPTLPATPLAHAKFGRAPLSGSTLINGGPNICYAGDGSTLASDEIGQVRNLDGVCDIGAIEYGAAQDRIFAATFQ